MSRCQECGSLDGCNCLISSVKCQKCNEEMTAAHPHLCYGRDGDRQEEGKQASTDLAVEAIDKMTEPVVKPQCSNHYDIHFLKMSNSPNIEGTAVCTMCGTHANKIIVYHTQGGVSAIVEWSGDCNG